MEKFLVTSALPYANGRLHLGHVAGAYLPADIFVRFLKLNQKDVIYICGTDEHGAPISIKAEAEGTTPQNIVNRYHESIKRSFEGLDFIFDNFSGTARPEHHKLASDFFLQLFNKDLIKTKTNKQFYCEHDKRFLADRYVEGNCPFCNAAGARGDQCDACGKLIDAVTLQKPKCKLCGNTPVIKSTKHWFLDLPALEPKVKKWLATKTYWKDNVHKFIMNWLDEGLIERAITRDINWGVPVPLEDSDGKVLYVWFDAPIGYISSTIEWAKNNGSPESWKDYWLNPDTKLIHFLGKDNIPFHTIIWPAVLMEQKKGYVLPYDVPANEYLNLEGDKISTSRNWAVWAEDALKHFDSDMIRYVLAVNAPETKDSDFTWKDFQTRVNTELADVLGNLAHRVFTFANKHFGGIVKNPGNFSQDSADVLAEVKQAANEIYKAYSTYQVRKTVKLAMDIARNANKYFDKMQPWKQIKTDKEAVNQTLYICMQILKTISIFLSPVIPKSATKLQKMMGLENGLLWKDLNSKPDSFNIDKIAPLFRKIEDSEVEKQIELLKQNSVVPAQEEEIEIEAKPTIEFDDFCKLELRIVKIIHAEKIKKSKKLLKLKISYAGNERELVSGISQHYKPEDIIGKKVAMLLNLKPRKIMGVMSEGMILAAEDASGLSLLIPDKDLSAGSEIS